MTPKRGLGRGLGALIKDNSPAPAPAEPSAGITTIPVRQIRKNTFQPRHRFDEAALAELTDSIKQRGVLQPLLVRKAADHFELIAGERRLRAATHAGLTEVPVIIMDVDDGVSLELALIENLQRENLNAIEEAEGYQLLIDRFGMIQEQIAEKVGKARASVANALRLLVLPDEVKQMVVSGEISPGHAKALTSLEIEAERIALARRAAHERLSVRALEALIRKAARTKRKPRTVRSDIPPEHLRYLSDRLHQHFGTGVKVIPCRTFANGKKAKGFIEIEFYSNDDMDRVLTLLGLSGD